jgi:hypothetical protein
MWQVPDNCSHILPPPTFEDSNLFHQRHSTSSGMVKQAHTQFSSPTDGLLLETMLSTHLKLVPLSCFWVYSCCLCALDYSVCLESKRDFFPFLFCSLVSSLYFILPLHNVQERQLIQRVPFFSAVSMCELQNRWTDFDQFSWLYSPFGRHRIL